MGFQHGHRKTTTLVAGLRMTGIVAPMVLDRPINGDWLEAHVAQFLVPELRPGGDVIMDNLWSHKRAAVKWRIEAAGATLHFLPPYSTSLLPWDIGGIIPPTHDNRDIVMVRGDDRYAWKELEDNSRPYICTYESWD